MNVFVTVVGYLLGILILLWSAKIYRAGPKFILKILANSIIGCVTLSVFKIILAPYNISIGINPITAVCTGILGIPGTIAVILTSVFL